MNLANFFRKYLEVIIASLLAVYYALELIGIIPEIPGRYRVVYFIVLIAFALILGIDFFFKKIKLVKSKENLFDELETNLAKTRIPFIIQVRNIDLEDISFDISKVIGVSNTWNWLYFGKNSTCGKICNKFSRELRRTYFSTGKNLKTSAIHFLHDYFPGNFSYIFTGYVLGYKEELKDERFGEHPYAVNKKESYILKFEKLYEIETGWNMEHEECVIFDSKIIDNEKKVQNKWESIMNEIKSNQRNMNSLSWKMDNSNSFKETKNTENILFNETFDCEKNVFVINDKSRTRNLIKFLRNKKIMPKIILFLGWILSPFIFYDDFFVNIPLSLFIAHLGYSNFGFDYTTTSVIAYTITNFLGVFMVIIGLKKMGLEVFVRYHYLKTITTFLIFTALAFLIALSQTH